MNNNRWKTLKTLNSLIFQPWLVHNFCLFFLLIVLLLVSNKISLIIASCLSRCSWKAKIHINLKLIFHLGLKKTSQKQTSKQKQHNTKKTPQTFQQKNILNDMQTKIMFLCRSCRVIVIPDFTLRCVLF